MTRLLYVLLFVMTTPSWGQGLVFENEDAPPAKTVPAAPKAPAKTPAAPANNFARCPHFTEKATDAVAMIQDVLNIPQPIGKTMASQDGNSFKLLRTRRDELQIEAVIVGQGSNDGRHHLAGAICQMRDGGLQVRLVHDSGFYTGFITVRPVSADQVRITSVEGGRENPRKSGIYSIQ